MLYAEVKIKFENSARDLKGEFVEETIGLIV